MQAIRLAKKIIQITIASTITCFSTISLAQDWYDSIGSHCSGSTPLRAGIATFLPSKLMLVAIPPAGNFVVQIQPVELASYLANNPYSFSLISIDKAKASSLREIFKQSSDKVPFTSKLTNAFLLNYAVPNIPLNIAAGVLFDYFYQNIEAESVFIENAMGFVAVGGQLANMVSIRRSQNGGRFLLSQITYTVSLGAEIRSFILSACQFPVSINVTEFQTAGQLNNKIVKPRNGNVWGVFDLTDNKWDSLQLRYVRQDVDDLVFESDKIEDSGAVSRSTHRLSIVGGSWSVKRSDSDLFKDLYLNINAK